MLSYLKNVTTELFLQLINYHAMETNEGVEVQLHVHS